MIGVKLDSLFGGCVSRMREKKVLCYADHRVRWMSTFWKWMVRDDDHRVDACVCSLVSVQVLSILLWLRFQAGMAGPKFDCWQCRYRFLLIV